MHLSQVHCRCCGKAFNLATGCAICQSARDNMVKPSLDGEFQGLGISALMQQQLRILKLASDRLENVMHDGMHPKDMPKPLDPSTYAYDPQHGREAMALAKAAAALLGDARKLDQMLEMFVQMLSTYPTHLIEQAQRKLTHLLQAPAEADLVE